MALHTLSLTGNLQCSAPWGGSATVAVPTAADVAAIAASITSDMALFAGLNNNFPGGIVAVEATGTLNSNNQITSVAARGGGIPITQINPGDLVLGIGIVLGTFVQSISGNTVTLSQAASASGAGVSLIFVRQTASYGDPNGGIYNWPNRTLLNVPHRGQLKISPGDVLALDNTGFPYVIPLAAINYPGSQWTFT